MLIQPHNASSQVAGAIRQAASSTGASFNYLLATAQIESNFNPAAQASTSSAKGLYQFIDQTWLATMKAAGNALGFGRHAAAISRGEDGRFEVQDPDARKAIMNLRGDAKVSAMMAGHYAQVNTAHLTEGLGRAPTEGELYIAHFLGADGASRLINAAATQPNSRGADMFPAAANANRSIFYDRAGSARSSLAVYLELTGRYDTARANIGADVAASPLRGALAPEPPMPIPDTAGVAQAYAAAQAVSAVKGPIPPPPPASTVTAFADGPARPAAFQSIFSDVGRQGVGPVVRTLWSRPADGAASVARPRNLFGD